PRCWLTSLLPAAEATTVTLAESLARELPAGSSGVLQWGIQREVVALDSNTRTAAAGYIAKYATKATETATGGTLVKPNRSPASLAHLKVDGHARALIAAAWTIGERTGVEALKRWAQQFGYGGHTLTKSHHYSV